MTKWSNGGFFKQNRDFAEELRKKTSDQRTMSDVLSLAMMSGPEQQIDLGLELEDKILETVWEMNQKFDSELEASKKLIINILVEISHIKKQLPPGKTTSPLINQALGVLVEEHETESEKE